MNELGGDNSIRIKQQLEFKLYPNPSEGGDFRIQLDGSIAEKEVLLSIFDINGIEVYSEKIYQTKKHINTSTALPSGIYLVKIKSKHQFGVHRLVII